MTDGISLVFVPLKEEMEYIHHHLSATGSTCGVPYDEATTNYTFTYELSTRATTDVYFEVIGDIGNLRAAARIAPKLYNLDPHFCYLVGVAGSLDSGFANLGDVVIATRAKMLSPDKIKEIDGNHEAFIAPAATPPSGLRGIDERKRYLSKSFFRYRRDSVERQQSSPLADQYVAGLRNKSPLPLVPVTNAQVLGLPNGLGNFHPSIKRTAILASEMVVDSQEYIAFLHDKNVSESTDLYRYSTPNRQEWFKHDLHAVDMETLGFLKIVNALGSQALQAFSVRGISDLANNKASLDATTKDEVRKIAVRNALTVVLDMIEVGILRRRGGRP